jgi:acyl carrier protein
MNQVTDSFVFSEVRRIFREVFEKPDMAVEAEASLDQMPDWDSIAHIKLVLAIEEVFGIVFETDEVASIQTAGAFARAVEKRRLRA